MAWTARLRTLVEESEQPGLGRLLARGNQCGLPRAQVPVVEGQSSGGPARFGEPVREVRPAHPRVAIVAFDDRGAQPDSRGRVDVLSLQHVLDPGSGLGGARCLSANRLCQLDLALEIRGAEVRRPHQLDEQVFQRGMQGFDPIGPAPSQV